MGSASAFASAKGRTIGIGTGTGSTNGGSLAEWNTRNEEHNKQIKGSTNHVHDLYGFLRVWPKVGNVGIRDAYHQLVIEAGAHGPDEVITIAYSILAHPLKRAQYDRDRLHFLYAMTSRAASKPDKSFRRDGDCLRSLMDYADELAARVAQQQANAHIAEVQLKMASITNAGQREPVGGNNVGNTFEEDDLYTGVEDDYHRKLRGSNTAAVLSRAEATGSASTNHANNTSTDTATKGNFNNTTATTTTTSNGSPFGDRNEEELMANQSNGNAHKGLVSKQLPHLAAKKKKNKTVKVGSSAAAVARTSYATVVVSADAAATAGANGDTAPRNISYTTADAVRGVDIHGATDTRTTTPPNQTTTTPIAVKMDNEEDNNKTNKDTPSPQTFMAQFPPLTMNGLGLSDFAKFPPAETDLFNMDEATTALALSCGTSPARTVDESLTTTGVTAATTPAVSTPGINTPTYMQPEGSNSSSSHGHSQSQTNVHAINTMKVDNNSRRVTWQEPLWSSPPKSRRAHNKSGKIVIEAPDLRIRTPVPAAVTTKAMLNLNEEEDGDDNEDGDWPQYKRPNRPWRTSAPNDARALAKALAAASDKNTKGGCASNGGEGHSRADFLELTAAETEQTYTRRHDSVSHTEHAAKGHGYSHGHGYSPRAAPVDGYHNPGNVHAGQQQQHLVVSPRPAPMIHMPVPIPVPTPTGFMPFLPLMPPSQAVYPMGPPPPAHLPPMTPLAPTTVHYGEDSMATMDREAAIRDFQTRVWTLAEIARAEGGCNVSSSSKVEKKKKKEKKNLSGHGEEAIAGFGDTQSDYPRTLPPSASIILSDGEDEAKIVNDFFRHVKYEPSR